MGNFNRGRENWKLIFLKDDAGMNEAECLKPTLPGRHAVEEAWASEIAGPALLLRLLFFFTLVDEFGDGLGAFEAGNGCDTFGEDARVRVQLFCGFYRCKCSGCFFKNAHGKSPFLLCIETVKWGEYPARECTRIARKRSRRDRLSCSKLQSLQMQGRTQKARSLIEAAGLARTLGMRAGLGFGSARDSFLFRRDRAVAERIDDRLAESGNVVGLTAKDELAVGHNLLIDPVRAGIFQVSLE